MVIMWNPSRRLAKDSPAEASTSAPFEVLISDIVFLTAWLDLVRKARARWPHMRIGVVTGWEGNRSTTTEADFVLRKPIPPAELVALVAPAS